MDMNLLQQLCEQIGYRTMNYSGRGMFGAQCLAVVVPKNEMFTFTANIVQHHAMTFTANFTPTIHNGDFVKDELESDMNDLVVLFQENMSVDEFGLNDKVFYFPTLEYVPK